MFEVYHFALATSLKVKYRIHGGAHNRRTVHLGRSMSIVNVNPRKQESSLHAMGSIDIPINGGNVIAVDGMTDIPDCI